MLTELVERAGQCGKFVSGTSGNVSIRQEGKIWISPTGIRLDRLRAEDMVCLDEETGRICGGGRPSKEWAMHWSVYRERPELRALFHLHPVDCIAAGILLYPRELPLYTPAHSVKLGQVRMVGQYPAGSEELAKHTAQAFAAPDTGAALLLRHGCITGGRCADEAYGRAEYLMEACRLYILLTGSGAAEERR